MKSIHIIISFIFATIVYAQNRSNWSQSRGIFIKFSATKYDSKGRLIDLETSDNLSFTTISMRH